MINNNVELTDLRVPETAYWIGVLHSDGKRVCYYLQKNGKRYLRWEVALEVSPNSFPMLERFVQIFETKFGRKLKIHRLSNGKYKVGTSVKRLIETFEELGIHFRGTAIPSWMKDDTKSFGAYLAGRIDGDGDIRIKGRIGKLRPTPQCVIRITDGSPQIELKSAIEKHLKCKALITKRSGKSIYKGRIINGEWYTLEFLVSRKNIEFIEQYIFPNLTIPHKRLKMKRYFAEFLDARIEAKACASRVAGAN